jgi:hypothetical protein
MYNSTVSCLRFIVLSHQGVTRKEKVKLGALEKAIGM